MKKTDKKKENRFVRAWKVLWGYDKETDLERRRRGRRKTVVLLFSIPAIGSLSRSVIISILVERPFWNAMGGLAITLACGILALVLTNRIYKFYQDRYEID